MRDGANASGGGGDQIRGTVRINAVLLALGYVVGAACAASAASLLGVVMHVREIEEPFRVYFTAATLTLAAAVDLRLVPALTMTGLRRQTPKFAFSGRVRPLYWGLDAGLMVTTYRESAATWAVLTAAFFGLVNPIAVGAAYGFAFALPSIALVLPNGLNRIQGWRSQSTECVVRRLRGARSKARLFAAAAMLATAVVTTL